MDTFTAPFGNCFNSGEIEKRTHQADLGGFQHSFWQPPVEFRTQQANGTHLHTGWTFPSQVCKLPPNSRHLKTIEAGAFRQNTTKFWHTDDLSATPIGSTDDNQPRLPVYCLCEITASDPKTPLHIVRATNRSISNQRSLRVCRDVLRACHQGASCNRSTELILAWPGCCCANASEATIPVVGMVESD